MLSEQRGRAKQSLNWLQDLEEAEERNLSVCSQGVPVETGVKKRTRSEEGVRQIRGLKISTRQRVGDKRHNRRKEKWTRG